MRATRYELASTGHAGVARFISDVTAGTIIAARVASAVGVARAIADQAASSNGGRPSWTAHAEGGDRWLEGRGEGTTPTCSEWSCAAGRHNQAVNVARAERKLTKSKEDAAVEKEVVRAMKQGTALVQASLDRLEGAERSWNKHVKDAGVRINSYPTEKQVLTYFTWRRCRGSGSACAYENRRRAVGYEYDMSCGSE